MPVLAYAQVKIIAIIADRILMTALTRDIPPATTFVHEMEK